MNSQEAKFFKAIGARIAEARKAQGLTQTQLAEHLGLAQQTYAHYENGRLRFPASILPTLIQVLGVAPDEAAGPDGNPGSLPLTGRPLNQGNAMNRTLRPKGNHPSIQAHGETS